MAILIYRDPAPRLVAYLANAFTNYKSAYLPEGLTTSAYADLGAPFPHLIFSYDRSDQVDPHSCLFDIDLEWIYEPEELTRGSDDAYQPHEELQRHLEQINDALLDFLIHEDLRGWGLEITKQGVTTSRVERDEAGVLSFVQTLNLQMAYSPPEKQGVEPSD